MKQRSLFLILILICAVLILGCQPEKAKEFRKLRLLKMKLIQNYGERSIQFIMKCINNHRNQHMQVKANIKEDGIQIKLSMTSFPSILF
jgi:hypothetical protein